MMGEGERKRGKLHVRLYDCVPVQRLYTLGSLYCDLIADKRRELARLLRSHHFMNHIYRTLSLNTHS